MLSLLERQLAGRGYLVGEAFSIADAILAPMLDYLDGLPVGKPLLAEHPVLETYLQRLRQRESSQRVLIAPTTG